MADSDCIFCKIVAGEIPSTKVFEDDRFLAFMDINPVTKGHCLIIPKEHHQDLFAMPENLLGDLLVAAQKLGRAVVQGMQAQGLNLIQSNGRAANQIIDHFHMHLIPRNDPSEMRALAWEGEPGAVDALPKAAELIRKSL